MKQQVVLIYASLAFLMLFFLWMYNNRQHQEDHIATSTLFDSTIVKPKSKEERLAELTTSISEKIEYYTAQSQNDFEKATDKILHSDATEMKQIVYSLSSAWEDISTADTLQSELADKLRKLVIPYQRVIFPTIRHRFADIMNEGLWKEDCKAHLGVTDREIVYEGISFIANKAKLGAFNAMKETAYLFRFEYVSFCPISSRDCEGFTINSPRDTALVIF